MKDPGFEAQTVETPVSNVGIVPTLLAAAGALVPETCVGSDLHNLVADPPEQRFVFTEVDGTAMVTSGGYRRIRNLSDEELILYDRRRDPDERQDRLNDEPAVRDELCETLDAHVEMTRSHTGKGRDVDVGDDVKDRLQRLGYTD